MAELNLDKMAKNVAEKAIDDFVFQGKTIREWIDDIAKFVWIPVSVGLPEEGVMVLITWNGDIDLGKYEDCEWWWLAEAFCDYWKEAGEVTAWMPLPEPYKREGD